MSIQIEIDNVETFLEKFDKAIDNWTLRINTGNDESADEGKLDEYNCIVICPDVLYRDSIVLEDL